MQRRLLAQQSTEEAAEPLYKRYNQFSRNDNVATAIYSVAWIVLIVGFAYAAVPLYRLFCQVCVSFDGALCVFRNCTSVYVCMRVFMRVYACM